MSRPIVVTACMAQSSESGHHLGDHGPWHLRAGGGAVHSIRFGHASLYRREPRQAGHCDLRTVFPKVISGLRRPIAIQAAISLSLAVNAGFPAHEIGAIIR